MQKCWWCIWYNNGRCLFNAPAKVNTAPDAWCENFAGVPDCYYDQREKRYAL